MYVCLHVCVYMYTCVACVYMWVCMHICVCMNVCVYVYECVSAETLDPPGAGCRPPIWMLRTGPGSPARVECAFNYWAVSPALGLLIQRSHICTSFLCEFLRVVLRQAGAMVSRGGSRPWCLSFTPADAVVITEDHLGRAVCWVLIAVLLFIVELAIHCYHSLMP